MAVMGRQKLYVYLASQQVMAASAIARFSAASSRAFPESVVWWCLWWCPVPNNETATVSQK